MLNCKLIIIGQQVASSGYPDANKMHQMSARDKDTHKTRTRSKCTDEVPSDSPSDLSLSMRNVVTHPRNSF